MSLEGLREELEKFEGQEVVASILDQGTELREFARDVEEKLRLVELESIQDYIAESDNLVALHDQIRLCDSTLLQMEALLGGFQVTSTSNPTQPNPVGWEMRTGSRCRWCGFRRTWEPSARKSRAFRISRWGWA